MGCIFTFADAEWMDSVDSTNDELKRRLRAGAVPAGAVLAAKRQTGGRGRMGRTWVSPEGTGLFFSFVWRGKIAPMRAGTLPMACSLGVRDFLGGFEIEAWCKWPNDVLTAKGKLCGILTESAIEPDGAVALVIGIGVNVRRDPVRDMQVTQPASCIADFVEDPGSVESALSSVLACVEKRVREWDAGGFSAVRNDFENALRGKGSRATVRTGSAGAVSGVIEGLGDDGALLVRLSDGTLYPVTSAAALEADEGTMLDSR